MDYSVTFARHFSRLVWLLLNDGGNIDEQKAALRALVTVSKDGAVTLATSEWRLVVNGEMLPEALTGVQDLTAQLIGHAVREVRVDQNAIAADLLGLARVLAAEPAPGDGGKALEQRLRALGATTLRVTVSPPPVPAPSVPTPGSVVAQPRTSKAVPVPGAGPGARSADSMPDLLAGESSGSYLAFAAVQARGTPAELLKQLDGTKSINAVTRTLDELVTLVENAARDGKPEAAAEGFHGVVAREAVADEGDLKRAYGMAVRRLTKPTILRPIAMLVPRHRDKAKDYVAVLARAGEDGADALIEQLTAAQTLSERRMYFDALVTLNAGVPALIHMLGDARWYVARNAADLLGEMQAKEAEVPLAELLKHNDDRVRRAAAAALAKLGTPRAHEALRGALRDGSAQVRMQAAVGLGARKGARAALTLGRALDEEEDGEVQTAIIAALGRLATSDAVQRLVKLAEPSGSLFKKKPTALRIAAVEALGVAHTRDALLALQELTRDKDKEVADAAFKAATKKA